jgi:hypothetical protein
VDAARYLADLLRSTGRRAEAIDTLERGLRTLPTDRTSRIASAVALLSELRHELSLGNA